MNLGMLWFDNDPNTDLGNKIKRAADYYHAKYGETPNICVVHPAMLGENGGKGKKKKSPSTLVELETSDTILPNHLWIGLQK